MKSSALPTPEPADAAAPSLDFSQTSPRNTACSENWLGICTMCAGEGRNNSISLVLCKAQLPTASRASALSKVLISSSIKLPLMGLSAPSRSKEGTWPAALSCFTCTAPLIILVSQMCSSHTHANNRPPTQVFRNILRFWFLPSHPLPTETQLIFWGGVTQRQETQKTCKADGAGGSSAPST